MPKMDEKVGHATFSSIFGLVSDSFVITFGEVTCDEGAGMNKLIKNITLTAGKIVISLSYQVTEAMTAR
ncbi:hypothetical protein LFAB_02110 [Lactiplantibacillus fabifermentans T30PCM01]|uniref:Uncharacterized protein n=2 Tax=Lactiplantibacillus fabifermentans TaxID=483011 RepID=A0A0R2NIB5_9LACO|nr:hypothetical protein LFAB_02110 [Lactiplantibacillus fabifermentans T30PCM01]KRO25052.1 hypothetical protein DY78_GL001407 [Lactiplantibacillus fabifermentans DSM 21115]